MPMYDYRCDKCQTIFEAVRPYEKREFCTCECGSIAVINWSFMPRPTFFPSGRWETLSWDPVEVRSKRHLRELIKKRNDTPDETKHCYAKVDDGIGGY